MFEAPDWHAMIDIETMSTTPNAAVASIGACVFDIATQDRIENGFEVRISLADNSRENRHFDGDTIEWWLSQDNEAQLEVARGEFSLGGAVGEFNFWLTSIAPITTCCWANDPDFDLTILKSAFDQVGAEWPYHFAAGRSCRTLFELAYPDKKERNQAREAYKVNGVEHKAKDDAIAQARMVQDCVRVLGVV